MSVWETMNQNNHLCRDIVYQNGSSNGDIGNDSKNRIQPFQFDGFWTRCLSDALWLSDKRDFKNSMAGDPNFEYVKEDDGGCVSGDHLLYRRKFDTKKDLDCCFQYNRGEPGEPDRDQLRDCNPYNCVRSYRCKERFTQYCGERLKPIADHLVRSLQGTEPKLQTPELEEERFANKIQELIHELQDARCVDESNLDAIKNGYKLDIQQYSSYMNELLLLVVDELKNPKLSKTRRDLFLDLLKTPGVALIAKTNEPFQKKLNEFCNDSKIFSLDKNWEELNSIYGPICNCFYDSLKNNGNPAFRKRMDIENLKTKADLPEELKQFVNLSLDIEPRGHNRCWFNDCMASTKTVLKPNVECASNNIASCMSYINFVNTDGGTIEADNINIVADWYKKDINYWGFDFDTGAQKNTWTI